MIQRIVWMLKCTLNYKFWSIGTVSCSKPRTWPLTCDTFLIIDGFLGACALLLRSLCLTVSSGKYSPERCRTSLYFLGGPTWTSLLTRIVLLIHDLDCWCMLLRTKPRWWRRYVPPKSWLVPAGQHGAINDYNISNSSSILVISLHHFLLLRIQGVRVGNSVRIPPIVSGLFRRH